VLLQSAAFSGVFTGFGVARDFEGGFAKRLMLARAARSGIVLGYALAALVRWSIVAVLLTVVAFAVGMNIGGGAIDLAGLYVLAALVNFCGFFWAGGSQCGSGRSRPGQLMQMPVFLILFFAPVYVPLDLLEGWIPQRRRPSTRSRTCSRRGGASCPVIPPHIAGAFAIAIGLGLLFWAWAFRGLRSAEAAGGRRRARAGARRRPAGRTALPTPRRAGAAPPPRPSDLPYGRSVVIAWYASQARHDAATRAGSAPP
jgi:ABC-2 type transport system permease protein